MQDSVVESLADRVAACCLAQYRALPSKGARPGVRSDGRYEWTVISGMVLEIQGEYHCISLCTGVKALSYGSLSPHGDLLHDSHAEVLARRGARTWLLLRLIDEYKSECRVVNGLPRLFWNSTPSRWKFGDANTKLHLYCSELPCGDASSPVPLQRKLGVGQGSTLRGRAYDPQGTLRLRTKPGKGRSEASLSMSCTDKIALWSAVGMQGTLLSRWVDPIFIDSLIIGSDPWHLDADVKDVAFALQSCEAILLQKLGERASNDNFLKVLGSKLHFEHSRDRVRRKLLQDRADAKITGSTEELDYVPAAGSITWYRDSRVQNVVEGKRQGAAYRRGQLLAPTSRSALCKRDWFNLILKAKETLDGPDRRSCSQAYYEAKRDCSNVHQAAYRRAKAELQGCPSRVEGEAMLNFFLQRAHHRQSAAAAAEDDDDHEEEVDLGTNIIHRDKLPRAPFSGWLVGQPTLEMFRADVHC